MPPKSYRPLPSDRSLAANRFYPRGGVQRRGQFFGRSARQSRFVERKAMINREHDLPITKQAQVLRISRGSVYYLTRPMLEADLAIMRRLDRLHLEFPFAGSPMLQGPAIPASGLRSLHDSRASTTTHRSHPFGRDTLRRTSRSPRKWA